MRFVPANIQLPMPFRSRLTVRHGTDRRTDDGHQRLMPLHYGGGGIIIRTQGRTYAYTHTRRHLVMRYHQQPQYTAILHCPHVRLIDSCQSNERGSNEV